MQALSCRRGQTTADQRGLGNYRTLPPSLAKRGGALVQREAGLPSLAIQLHRPVSLKLDFDKWATALQE
jgi:hypothetical protein